MAYPCDLPANMGNNDIFRAIYAKLSDINPNTVTIEQKLDVIQDQLTVVNNNIEANTKAIKDISINIDFPTEDLQNITNAIDRQTQVIKDASPATKETITKLAVEMRVANNAFVSLINKYCDTNILEAIANQAEE